MGNLVFIGDVHLDRGDPSLADFLAFLGGLTQSASRVVLLGDLFNLWLGRPELEQPHHRAVAERLEQLRRAGVVVRYVEGNRDYRIGDRYTGTALDEVSDAGIVESFGGHRVFAVHGDLANVEDRQYRLWRRFSRSTPVWRLFNLLPERLRSRFAERLESSLRATNLDFKRSFPEQRVREYAARYLGSGHDLVVLGHFHVEQDLRVEAAGATGRVLVLPEWRSSRRHLELTPDGEVAFVDSLA